MNHDYAHCLDYTENCPKDCFRAELQRDIEENRSEFIGVPLTYAHFRNTVECKLVKDKDVTCKMPFKTDCVNRQAAIDGGNDGIIQLQQGDCLELMKNIPDGSVDMILCDLPYGTTRNKWDSVIDFDELWTAYKRIIKNNGAIVLFCDGMFTAKLLTSNPRMWRYNLVWDKQKGCDFLNANVKPLKCHEDIAVFYKHKPTYNKQYWYSEPYKLTKNGTLSANYGNRNEAWSESVNGERNPLTILSFAKDSDRKHPTQKPIALLEWLIKTYTNEGDIVLDNCMGSGSTGVACVNLNRKFIGMELKQEYFNIATERINDARLNQQTGGDISRGRCAIHQGAPERRLAMESVD